MGSSLRNWSVLIATAFSVVLILGAFLLARGVENPPIARASSESALLQAIATKDSDNDGLPDWEESLYGTDPHNPDTFHLGMTDGEAVAKGLIVPKAVADIPTATSTVPVQNYTDPSLPPAPADGTLTDAFAKSFFTTYMAAKQQNGGAELSADQINTIAQQVLANLAASITTSPNFKSAKDLTVSGSGADALRVFAIAAEAISEKNTANASQSEIFYLRDAVASGTPGSLAAISSIAKSYRETAVGLAVLPVPQELAGSDLSLINALMRLSQITSDFTKIETDSLATMIALQQYPQAILDLGHAFIDVSNAYKAAGVSIAPGAPGASFVNLITDVAAEEKPAPGKAP